MLSSRFLIGMKVVLGLLPILMGVTMIVMLSHTRQWLALLGMVLVVLLVVCSRLDFPLQTVWPLFPGVFLMLASSVVLYQGDANPGNTNPFAFASTSQLVLLIALFVIALLYIVWAVRATWKAYIAY